MKTTAKENVLPRDPEPYLKEKLNLFANTLEEIVNFGTHLLIADIQKKRSGKDNFVPTLFLRNILDISDSISILIRKSATDPAKIQLRSLLESCLNLAYSFFPVYRAIFSYLPNFFRFVWATPNIRAIRKS